MTRGESTLKVLTAITGLALACTIPTNNYTSRVVQSQDQKPVVLATKVINNLAFLYDGIPREIPLCLRGTETSLFFYIRDVALPIIIANSDTSASYIQESCYAWQDYLGMAHPHTIVEGYQDQCGASTVDYNRFIEDEKARLEMVVCEASVKGDSLVTFVIQKPQ